MRLNKNGKMTSAAVANQVDISTKTLNQWYKFYYSDEPKPEDMPELPAYEQAYEKAPRYWNPEDIPKILAFKEWIPRGHNGIMGKINAPQWTLAYRAKRKAKEEAANQDVLEAERKNNEQGNY